jgi:hypothetical protein
MKHFTKGWDAFQPDPGIEDRMFCRVCGQEMEVSRNVIGPRSSIEAMGNHKSAHDSFTCKDSHKDWHEQALAILEFAQKTPSKMLEIMLKTEAQEIIDCKQATKDDYSRWG